MKQLIDLFKLPMIYGLLLSFLSVVSQAEIVVTDDFNNQISLSEHTKTVISLAPNLTELLFHIGAGGQIIGSDEYSNYPEDAKKITRVNNHSIANYELILALEPDIVFAWHSGNGMEIINRLRELGLTVFVVETAKMDQFPDLFNRLGAITGNTTKARELAVRFSDDLTILKSRYSTKTKVRTFYQIWDDPMMTLNGEHLVSDVIEICGGENIFAEAPPLVPRVNIEGIMRADPQVILSTGTQKRVTGWREKWARWSSITAVKKNHLYLIPPDLMQRQSNRILEGAGYVCRFINKYRINNS